MALISVAAAVFHPLASSIFSPRFSPFLRPWTKANKPQQHLPPRAVQTQLGRILPMCSQQQIQEQGSRGATPVPPHTCNVAVLCTHTKLWAHCRVSAGSCHSSMWALSSPADLAEPLLSPSSGAQQVNSLPALSSLNSAAGKGRDEWWQQLRWPSGLWSYVKAGALARPHAKSFHAEPVVWPCWICPLLFTFTRSGELSL